MNEPAGRDLRWTDEDELIEHWTLVCDELVEVGQHRGPDPHRSLDLAGVLLQPGPVPPWPWGVPAEVISYLARQVDVPAADLGSYEWSSTDRGQLQREPQPVGLTTPLGDQFAASSSSSRKHR